MYGQLLVAVLLDVGCTRRLIITNTLLLELANICVDMSLFIVVVLFRILRGDGRAVEWSAYTIESGVERWTDVID